MNAYLLFFLGLIIISLGAESLLKGAAKIAALLGIRPIVIGLTVVSLGTSLPELAVGVTAVHENAGEMAIGNIAGTNMVNLLLILGLSAAIRPLPLNIKAIKFEMFVMIFASILLFFLCLDGSLSVFDGWGMLICGVLYIILTVKGSKDEPPAIKAEYSKEFDSVEAQERKDVKVWLRHVVFLLVGMVATIWGADLLVGGATSIASELGLSDALIGLTIVAIGTSAPELVTTIIATFRNNRDVAIGNLLGSSITNILIILGATNAITGKALEAQDSILWFDLPLAALVAIVCYPVFKSGKMVSRTEGICFVLAYLLYLTYLIIYRT